MQLSWSTFLVGVVFCLPGLAGTAPEFARGADVGWLSQMESSKRVFKDASGKSGDLLDILKGSGINSIRLRVWVNPVARWCDSLDVAKIAKRAKDKEFQVMVDFHYSDVWADPGVQTKPVAWASHDIDQLKIDVANHTTNVLRMLRDSGVTPQWVQIGNETNNGMLWEEGRASRSMANFAALVQSGSAAAKAVFPQTKIVVHISNGYDNSLFRWIFDGLQKNSVEWDAVGMSLYPEAATWRATEAQCKANMQDMVSRYGKQVVISEVGMEWTQADSCYALLKRLLADVRDLSDGAGLGVFYWEPESFSGWNGYQKGAFDNTGKPTKAMDAFKEAAPPATIHARAPTRPATDPVHDLLGRRQQRILAGQNPIEVLPQSLRSGQSQE